MKKALVLFSGGQDSTTCLALALTQYDEVYTIGFDYGQRNIIELKCRQKIRSNIQKVLDLKKDILKDDFIINMQNIKEVSTSAYLNKEDEIKEIEGSLPTSFVPARNLIFLTYAAAKAYSLNIDNLIIGVSEADYSGYPDCRLNTIKSMEISLRLGLDKDSFKILTPLMEDDKSEVFARAYSIGKQPLVDFIINETHTCYEGNRIDKHEYGYGCGTCPACKLRKRGFEKFKQKYL